MCSPTLFFSSPTLFLLLISTHLIKDGQVGSIFSLSNRIAPIYTSVHYHNPGHPIELYIGLVGTFRWPSNFICIFSDGGLSQNWERRETYYTLGRRRTELWTVMQQSQCAIKTDQSRLSPFFFLLLYFLLLLRPSHQANWCQVSCVICVVFSFVLALLRSWMFRKKVAGSSRANEANIRWLCNAQHIATWLPVE